MSKAMFESIGLKGIASLVGVLGETHDYGDYLGKVVVDGKEISYDKEGDILFVVSSDGRRMSIEADAYEEVEKESSDRTTIYAHHDVDVNIYTKDGGRVNLKDSLGLPLGYEGFENVQRHNLYGVEIKSYNPCNVLEGTSSLELTKIDLGSGKSYYFESDGIHIGTNLVVSTNGNEIITLNGARIPNLNQVFTFDLDKQRELVNKFVNGNSELHDSTQRIIRECMESLNWEAYKFNEIKDYYYKGIRDLRKAIKFRDELGSKMERSGFSDDELQAVSREIRKEYLERKTALEKGIQKGLKI